MLEWIVPALVVAVIDGDTAKMKADIWPSNSIEINVRIEHIDTPEHDWRAGCEAERNLGATAKTVATQLFEGKRVFLKNVKNDKFGGRVVAEVLLPDGLSWGQILLDNGLAKPYEGGTKPNWCGQ